MQLWPDDIDTNYKVAFHYAKKELCSKPNDMVPAAEWSEWCSGADGQSSMVLLVCWVVVIQAVRMIFQDA